MRFQLDLLVTVRDYQANDNMFLLTIIDANNHSPFENKRKIYLGVSQAVGIDADFFDYKVFH
jgi:hypothetical protein